MRVCFAIITVLLAACSGSSTQIQTPPTVKSDCQDNGRQNVRDDDDRPTGGDDEREFSLRSAPTFDDEIEDLIADNCIDCHDSGGSDPDLSSWSDVEDARKVVVDAVEKERMPLSDDLDEDDIRMFVLWANANYPKDADDIEEDQGTSSSNNSGSSSSNSNQSSSNKDDCQ